MLVRERKRERERERQRERERPRERERERSASFFLLAEYQVGGRRFDLMTISLESVNYSD